MAPQGFLDANQIQQLLTDALTSFSPLGVLVGSDSARSMANQVTNLKQTFAISLAPIGALGVISTVCKGTNLSALKDMLGVGEADITDACSELGCGSLYGVIPRLSGRGGMVCQPKGSNRGVAACAILRGQWSLGDRITDHTPSQGLDIQALLQVISNFSGSTISGRLLWQCQDRDSQRELVECVQRCLLESWKIENESWDAGLFLSFDQQKELQLQSGAGMVELHWPAPAMPMETNATIVLLFIAVFTITPLVVVIMTTSPLIHWQSVPGGTLFLGGQVLLSMGHVAAKWTVQHQRRTVYLDIPCRGLAKKWTMVNNTWFTSLLARRPLHYHLHSPNHMRIGQHVEMKSDHVPALHALLTLTAIIIGFIAFYLGACSLRLYTILIYITIFISANLLKGKVIHTANKPYITQMNNPGFPHIVLQDNSGDSQLSLWNFLWSSKSNGSAPNEQLDHHDNEAPDFANKPCSNPMPTLTSTPGSSMLPSVQHNQNVHSLPHPDLFPLWLKISTQSGNNLQMESGSVTVDTATQGVQYRVYAKFAIRHPHALGMFYFSHPQTWATAAHVIYEASRRGSVDWQNHSNREPFLCIPFEFLENSDNSTQDTSGLPVGCIKVDAFLVLAIDETRNEDIFWSAGAEILSILANAFTDDTCLSSEHKESSDIRLLAAYVYYVTRMIIFDQGPQTVALSSGAMSMMQAIDLVRAKYPFDASGPEVVIMRQYAQAAIQSIEVGRG